VENVTGDGKYLFSRLHPFVASDIISGNAEFLINKWEDFKMYMRIN
jgi:hypothetical protein